MFPPWLCGMLLLRFDTLLVNVEAWNCKLEFEENGLVLLAMENTLRNKHLNIQISSFAKLISCYWLYYERIWCICMCVFLYKIYFDSVHMPSVNHMLLRYVRVNALYEIKVYSFSTKIEAKTNDRVGEGTSYLNLRL